MIDSHAHLDDPQFNSDREDVIARAKAAGVEMILSCGTDITTSRIALENAYRYDEGLLATAGIHPHHADQLTDAALADIQRMCSDRLCVAIGEAGLDYVVSTKPTYIQQAAFEAQLELAERLDMPVVVHCREAFNDCIAALSKRSVRGVFHCFSGGVKDAERVIDMGFLISFAGQITYKSALSIREAALAIPTEHILLETDSPYLAPAKYRGHRNEPANVTATARFVANLLHLSYEDIDRVTTTNFKLLFGLGAMDETTIVYRIRKSLYVNLTNRCTDNCCFCPRTKNPRVKGHWLAMKEADEPSAEKVIELIGDPRKYDEIVFCGFGEPTLRLPVLLEVAKAVKEKGGKTRLNTNGHSDIINGKPTAPLMKSVIDALSISLNTASPEQYVELCKPQQGEKGYHAMVAFIKAAKEAGIDVTVSALDYPGVDVEAVGRKAAELGVTFRHRKYKHLG